MSVKQYSYRGLAGCVRITRCRATGTEIGVYHSVQAGMETDPELPWMTVCEAHGTLVGHATRARALQTRSPEEFCDDCRAKAEE